jgi:hypothetical protein
MIRLRRRLPILVLLGCAGVLLLWGPWHGPVVLSLSGSHGIDTGDLPALLLLALAVGLVRGAMQGRQWPARRAVPSSAVALGALLILGGLVARYTAVREPLLPAGGGTFDGRTVHVDASRALPPHRWSHLAVTYDGAALRLYVNGTQASSRAVSGPIRGTADPLWLGGNRPDGEYFHGLIDQVRVYNRALSLSELRIEMWTPVESRSRSVARGLVGAYGFDRDMRRLAADTSGHRNDGTILGATWAPRGRFGGALRFERFGDVIGVPSAGSLNLGPAMTISAWVRPSASQPGWRTIVARETDAYFLMAGGGSRRRFALIQNVVPALFVGAALLFCAALACGGRRGPEERHHWWSLPVALFLAGSLVDAALVPSSTLVAPTLVAVWWAVTSIRRVETASMYVITAVFALVTVGSLAGLGALEPAGADGSVERALALGLLFVAGGVFDNSRRPATPS